VARSPGDSPPATLGNRYCPAVLAGGGSARRYSGILNFRHNVAQRAYMPGRCTNAACLGLRCCYSLTCLRGELYGRPSELTGMFYTYGAYCPWERLLGLRRGGGKSAPQRV